MARAPCVRRAPALLLSVTVLMAALSGVAQAAVDTAVTANAGGASAGWQKVPCSSLPELRHFALKVAILGDCEPSAAAAPAPPPPAGSVQMQSFDGSTQALEGWIFAWKNGATGAAGKLNSEACDEGGAPDGGRFNATCTHRYSAALPGFAAKFQRREQLALFLQAYADQLESAAPDAVVSLKRVSLADAGTAPAPAPAAGPDVHTASMASFSAAFRWGLDRLDQRSLPLDGYYRYYGTGDDVHVYILDTGIRATHEEFKYRDGRPGSRASEVFAAPSLDAAAAGTDCEGHGTHVAGVIGGLTFGVAKDAQLHAVRILDCNGNGAVSDVLLALDWLKVNAQRPAIVSMSLGGEVQLQLDEAVRSVTQEGIHVVVAAGNEDMDACDTSPAREASALTVAASTVQDQRLWLSKGKGSNYGECVDLFAPGTDILSAAGSADDAQQLRTGTSQAVPFVAGVVALILQNASATSPDDMRRLLVNSASGGQLTEPAGTGFASVEASQTKNLLLQSSIEAPITVSPASFAAIESASAGPFAFSLALSQAPTATVTLQLSVDSGRGTVQPLVMQFTPNNWLSAQTATLTATPFGSAASTPLVVHVDSTSADTLFRASQTVVSIMDRKGDTLNYPKAVTALPFAEQGSTGGASGTDQGHYTDQYNVVCGKGDADSGGSPDVVYYFKPATDCTVTASLCGSSALDTTFDSRLALLANVDQGGALQAVACSNDACGALPSLTASLKAGVGYAFVVDGVGGASGPYSISITAAEGKVAGSLPPASLLQASVSVASVGPLATASGAPSAGFTTEQAEGSDRYWLLGPWSACSSSCTQTRAVTCYASSGAELSDAQCSDLKMPANQQACTDCSGQVAGSASGGGSVAVIAACAVGAVLAVAAAVGVFLWVRRRRQRKVQQQCGGGGETTGHEAGPPAQPAPKWTTEEGELECIPLPKNLPPISTGRGGHAQRQPPQQPQQQHLVVAAGASAQLWQQQQQRQQQGGRGAGGGEPYASAAAHLQTLASEYHVVHMPSPRFPGQDTGSPSGVRRSLRQRSPTRRPRDGGGSRATPDAAPGEHRLARSGSGHPQHGA